MRIFKCRTFPKDTISFDYGKEHVLVKARYESGKEVAICLNDKDIDELIEYLNEKRKATESSYLETCSLGYIGF